MPDSVKILQEAGGDPTFLEKVIGFIAAVLGVLTIAIRKFGPAILLKKRKRMIKYDQDKLIEACGEVQDLTLKIGAMRGHIVYYENHGPQKFTIMWEARGVPCLQCVSKCEMVQQHGAIKRISRDWDKRKVHSFWLVNVVNKTLALDGKVHTVTYQEAADMHDNEQTDIWDDTGTYMVKECFVKPKGNSEFITVVFEFCKRFAPIEGADVKIENLARRLSHLL